MSLREKYPQAFEDDHGTIWASQQDAEAADWTWKGGDGFLDAVLGWNWEEAEENYALTLRNAKRKAFWTTHHRLRDALWFVTRWYRALAMFGGIVWREWNGSRISWSLAWELASDLWLAEHASRKEAK